ncbi:MAG: vitamin K epoxide reductase family protein [Mucilaginibacter sp.]
MVTFSKDAGKQLPPWHWLLIGLNLIALVLSGILSWHYLQGGSMPGCDGVSTCEQVLNSKWSTIGGSLPVSGLAMGAYLAMLVAGFFIGPATEAPIRRLAWSVLVVFSGLLVGGAVWFSVVQKWIIGDFCPYCMTAHITGILMAVIIITRARKVRHVTPLLPTNWLVVGGLILAGILAGGQSLSGSKEVYSEGKAQDNLPAITYEDVPMIGSPKAPYVIKLLFDYECPHCQKLHFMLSDAISRYAGKVAFALCPTPLNTQCNPYIPQDVDAFKNSCELAKIGLAVWVAKRSAFAEFDTWMFSYEIGDKWQPRSLEAARAKAVELVGRNKLDAASSSPWIAQYIQTCVQIYGQTIQSGRGGVPKLIFGPNWVIPKPADADDLMMILQKKLNVPRP